MKPVKLFCFTLLLMVVASTLGKTDNTTEKANTSEPHYKMTEAEAKVLAETKVYLKRGGEVDAIGDQSRTRLHKAVNKGYKTLAELLIEHGANVNAQDEYGLTPLHLAARSKKPSILIAKLLIDNGADVNIKHQTGSTPLHLAASIGLKAIAELLIVNGADVSVKNNRGRTPLHAAAKEGHNDIAELLIANGADVNAKDNKGRTPLDLAAEQGHKLIAELLVAKGADVKIKKTEGPDMPAGEFIPLTESVKSTLSELIELAESLESEIKKKTGFANTSFSSEMQRFLAKGGVEGQGSWALAHAYVQEGNYKKGIEEYHRYLKRYFISAEARAPAHAGLGDVYYELAILDMINRGLYQQTKIGLLEFTPDERVREIFKVAKREFDIATSLSRFIAEEKYHRIKYLNSYISGNLLGTTLTEDQAVASHWLLALSLKRRQLQEAPAHRYLSGHPYPLLKAARSRHLKEIDRLESNLGVQLKSVYQLTSSIAEWRHLWVFYQVLVTSEGEMGIKPEEKKKVQHCGQTILTHAGVFGLKLPFEVQQHLRLENNKPEHYDQLIQSLESQLESQHSALYHQLYGLVSTEFYMVPYLTHPEFFPESMIAYEVRRSLSKLAKIAQEVGVYPEVEKKFSKLRSQSSFNRDTASEVVAISDRIFPGILTNFRKTD